MDPRYPSIKAERARANLDMLRGSLKAVFRAPGEPGFDDLLRQLDRRAAA